MRTPLIVTSTGCLLAAGCVATPPMPPDFSLPIKAIVLHATCELRDALRSFEVTPPGVRLPPDFPHHWSMSIQLTPRVNTDFNARIGLTGTTRFPGRPVNHFNTFAIGGPGIGFDAKAWKNGAVTYYVAGRDLLNPEIVLDCTNARSTLHGLAQDFGVKEWLDRLIESANQSELRDTVSFDKPTFSAQIVVRMDGTGNFTYNFPLGTNFANVGGWYEVDETLSITFTPDPKPGPQIVQFPPLPTKQKVSETDSGRFTTFRRTEQTQRPPSRVGPRSSVAPAAPRGVSPAAKQRLDQMQNEQTIRNLQFIR